MKTFGDQLLACAALANDQDRAIKGRRTARPLDSIEKGQALPDELICPLHRADNWCLAPSVGKIFQLRYWRISAVFLFFSHFAHSGTILVYLLAIQA
ncbi:hypothetical protein [Sphingomonas daechungensis]|uniref:hypothetical protein n=1 Tax=Sphingomonas daechungensis TaxID=1176646 RepID=UPI001CB94858|nr:hypothetical protein [Sphingomonas daechungensis]